MRKGEASELLISPQAIQISVVLSGELMTGTEIKIPGIQMMPIVRDDEGMRWYAVYIRLYIRNVNGDR
jgi:hypothetical protein